MAKSFYITTTLPYVNAAPHLGFALEIIQADVLAKYHKLLGEDVFFNTGTDEHGQKIYKKFQEIKKVRGGYGIAIISTNKGLLTDKEARKNKLGGEVLCEIW